MEQKPIQQKPAQPKPVQSVQSADFRHLVRVANTDLDGNKAILHALRKIKGISFAYSNAVLSVADVAEDKKAGTLSDAEVNKIDEIIKNPRKHNIPTWILNRRKDYDTGEDKHLLTSDLTFTTENDIRMMKKIRSYKGVRHMLGLPVRGQKMRSNFRKNKGKVLGVKKPTRLGKT